MSTEDLQYLKRKFSTQVEEIEDEMSRRQTRLNNRLARQQEDATALATLQQELQTAQDTLAALQSHNEAATLIASAQELVNTRQAAVNEHTVSPNHISDREAQLIQMELDEMEQSKVLRNTRIGEIDTYLGT